VDGQERFISTFLQNFARIVSRGDAKVSGTSQNGQFWQTADRYNWHADCFDLCSNALCKWIKCGNITRSTELLACTLFELLDRIKTMNLRSTLLRAAAPSVTALAFAFTVAMTANAAILPVYAGIDPGHVTGELSNSGYSGVSGSKSGFTDVSGNGYNFVYAAGSVGGNPAYNRSGDNPTCGGKATCADSQYGNGAGSYNRDGSIKTPSGVGFWSVPAGGSGPFLALDSDYNTSGTNVGTAVQETVSSLIQGDKYTITFDTADAQQNTWTGGSQDAVEICLGTQCFTTANVIDASGSSTPWVAQSFTFIASNTSETLSFLGKGGSYPKLGSNVPAFALVDNLCISAPSPAPEPNSLILLGTGLAGLGGFVRSRFSKGAALAA
jgi:hypothetical protein